MDKKNIFMIVDTKIQFDARVQRSAMALSSRYNITLLSLNSDLNYTNPHFQSIVYTNKYLKGFLLKVVFWMYILYYSIINKKKIDLIYIHDYPIVIAGLIASFLTKKRWVYDAHELLLERKNTNIPIKRKFFIFLESISIKKANLVIAANDERERIIKYVYKLKNTLVVKNIAHQQIIYTNVKNRDKYIIYQGVVSKERDLRPFIDSLQFIDTEYSLKIIGGGNALNDYKQYVKDKGLDDRVFFTGKLSYNNLLQESINGKIGILVYPLEGLNNYYCAPNKIYEYCQIGLPIISSSQPFLINLVEKFKIGEILKHPLDAEDIAVKINSIILNYQNYQKNTSLLLENNSFEKEGEKLLNKMLSLG